MVAINISKIYVEQNKGFFKEIDNPHIQSPLEIPARFEDNSDLVITVHGKTTNQEITNAQARASLNLGEPESEENRILERTILETKHAIIPIVINDETNSDEVSQLLNYVSTFKRRVETNDEYVMELDSERVEQLNANVTVPVTKRFYKTTFKLPREPRNLYILYGSYSRVQTVTALGSSTEIEFERIAYDIIFERGSLKTESYLYHLENGDVWTGAVVLTDKNLFFTYEEQARPLQEKRTLNTRVIDLRIKAKIDQKKLNFKNLNESLLNNRIRQVQKPGKRFYFSEIFINQKNKIPSLSFFFNYRNFILDNCLFSKIYETIPENLARIVVNNSRISDIKIYRRRVKKAGKSKNKLSNTNESFELFEGEKEVVIAQSSQKANEATIANVGNFEEIRSLNRSINQQSRFFKFRDIDLTIFEEGMYQYKVQVEIDDFSIELIKNDIEILTNISKELQIHTDMEVTRILQPNASGTFPLSNQRADNFLNQYFSVLNSYFINESVSTTEEIFRTKQTLKSQIVSSAKEPRGILNFIKLVNDLISDLSQFVSLELFSFDDPHIDLISNNIEKNSKRTLNLENYFTNNVVDCSIKKIKNVNFFPNLSGGNYDNINIQQFLNTLVQLNSDNRIKNRNLLPASVKQGEFGFSIVGSNTQYSQTAQRAKFERQNILKNNINVAVLQYENNNLLQEENPENYDYREDINQFFDYCSQNLVENKTIDEVKDIFSDPNNSIVDQFAGQLEILTSTNTKGGGWTNLQNIGSLPSLYGNYLFFRIKTLFGDHKNKNWDSLKEITCTDPYFVLRVNSIQEANVLVQNINSLMGINILVSPEASETVEQDSLSDIQVEDYFFS